MPLRPACTSSSCMVRGILGQTILSGAAKLFWDFGRDETAAMFFREVVRATENEVEDSRADEARKFLNEIAAETTGSAAQDPDADVTTGGLSEKMGPP